MHGRLSRSRRTAEDRWTGRLPGFPRERMKESSVAANIFGLAYYAIEFEKHKTVENAQIPGATASDRTSRPVPHRRAKHGSTTALLNWRHQRRTVTLHTRMHEKLNPAPRHRTGAAPIPDSVLELDVSVSSDRCLVHYCLRGCRPQFLKAGHDLQIVGASVNLQAVRVKEARQGVTLAERQRDRAATQRNTYQEWLSAGLNTWERGMLDDYQDIRRYRNITAGIDAALTFAQACTSASSGGILGTGLGGGLAGAVAVGVLATARAVTTIQMNNAETSAQINSATASFERRAQEWELQRQLAEGELAIGELQIALAETHTEVALQEE